VFRHKPMELEDVATCVEIVAAHPVLGPRYGSAIDELGSAWRRVLRSDAFFSVVSKEGESKSAKILGSQTACFVTDDFFAELSTPPFRWLGPAFVNRILHGPSPIPSEAEIKQANSTGGLNLVVWPSCFLPDFEINVGLRQECQALFFQVYRGFQIKRMQTQAIHPMEFEIAINSGAWYLRGNDPQPSQDLANSGSVAMQPHVIMVTKEVAAQQPGTWIHQFFAYRKPKIGLPRSEQRLLSAALQGGTDEELAKQLEISLSAVKKMWASIYRRAESIKPSDLKFAPSENANGDRGREKKHKLLAYLREHPEELRPYSMKLLNRVAL
jgi:hypothetical protein